MKKIITDKAAFFREACGNAARVWVLAGEPGPVEVYVEGRWIMVTIQPNGQKRPPHRRAEDATGQESEK